MAVCCGVARGAMHLTNAARRLVLGTSRATGAAISVSVFVSSWSDETCREIYQEENCDCTLRCERLLPSGPHQICSFTPIPPRRPLRHVKVGDFVNIPAFKKHRVDWTTPDEPTVWLGVRYGEAR